MQYLPQDRLFTKKYGLTHIELRGIDGVSIVLFDKEKIKPIKNKLDVAQAVEAKYIRLFSFYPPTKDEDPTPYHDDVLKRINEFVKAAKSHEEEKVETM